VKRHAVNKANRDFSIDIEANDWRAGNSEGRKSIVGCNDIDPPS